MKRIYTWDAVLAQRNYTAADPLALKGRRKLTETTTKSAEAMALWAAFRRMEDAGAFSVEAEVIPAPVMAEISRRTRLITLSLGSGSGGDVICLFQNDICGEQPDRPRHARAFGDLHRLTEQIMNERRAALRAFRDAVDEGEFPGPSETAGIPDNEFQAFQTALAPEGAPR